MTTSPAGQPSPVCETLTVLRVGVGVAVGVAERVDVGDCVAEAPAPDGVTAGGAGALGGICPPFCGALVPAVWRAAPPPPITPFTAQASNPTTAMPRASA